MHSCAAPERCLRGLPHTCAARLLCSAVQREVMRHSSRVSLERVRGSSHERLRGASPDGAARAESLESGLMEYQAAAPAGEATDGDEYCDHT